MHSQRSTRLRHSALALVVLVTLSLRFTPRTAADAAITGVSNGGQLTDGATLTVTGTGFGIKNPVEPLKVDTFDQGSSSLGQVIDVDATGSIPWTSFASCAETATALPEYETRYTNAVQRYPGDVVGWKHYGDNAQYGCYQGTNYLGVVVPDGFEVAYWSMWISSTTNGNYENVRNVKIANWTNAANGYPQGRWDFYPAGGPTSGHLPVSGCATAPFNGWGIGYDAFNLGEQTWNRFDGLLRAGDPGIANGGYAIWRDGSVVMDSGNIVIRPTVDCPKPDSFYFTFYYDDVDEGENLPPRPTADFYHGEIYVDTTQSRVEICTGSTWATRGHCELQIPHTTWVDGQVQATAHQGSLPSDTSLSLYIVDATGTASAAYPITFATIPSSCSDGDADGYGSPADGSCANPELDCNDAAPGINPGATEICGNSIDEDCDGSDLVCSPVSDVTPPATVTDLRVSS